MKKMHNTERNFFWFSLNVCSNNWTNLWEEIMMRWMSWGMSGYLRSWCQRFRLTVVITRACCRLIQQMGHSTWNHKKIIFSISIFLFQLTINVYHLHQYSYNRKGSIWQFHIFSICSIVLWSQQHLKILKSFCIAVGFLNLTAWNSIQFKTPKLCLQLLSHLVPLESCLIGNHLFIFILKVTRAQLFVYILPASFLPQDGTQNRILYGFWLVDTGLKLHLIENLSNKV